MENKHCETIVDKAVVGFYELFGTMILTCGIVLIANNGGNLMGIPLALYAGIQIGGHISGGHFNPAVTLAIFIGRK